MGSKPALVFFCMVFLTSTKAPLCGHAQELQARWMPRTCVCSCSVKYLSSMWLQKFPGFSSLDFLRTTEFLRISGSTFHEPILSHSLRAHVLCCTPLAYRKHLLALWTCYCRLLRASGMPGGKERCSFSLLRTKHGCRRSTTKPRLPSLTYVAAIEELKNGNLLAVLLCWGPDG